MWKWWGHWKPERGSLNAESRAESGHQSKGSPNFKIETWESPLFGEILHAQETTTLPGETMQIKTHWTICSLHLGCRSPSQSSCMPGSPRSLLLRSILIKFLLAIRAAVRSWQAELETRHLFSLERKKRRKEPSHFLHGLSAGSVPYPFSPSLF